MSLAPLERTEELTDTGSPRLAHIVFPASALVDAMVAGTSVTALCGHTWVPGRDPKKFPLCSACKEIWDEHLSHLGEVPDA